MTTTDTVRFAVAALRAEAARLRLAEGSLSRGDPDLVVVLNVLSRSFDRVADQIQEATE